MQASTTTGGPGDRLTLGGSFNALYLMAHCHALTCTVFLRTDFGAEGIGMGGLVAGSADSRLRQFCQLLSDVRLFPAVGCGGSSASGSVFSNWRRGRDLHSRYNGYPFVSKRLFPRMSELELRGHRCLPLPGHRRAARAVQPAARASS